MYFLLTSKISHIWVVELFQGEIAKKSFYLIHPANEMVETEVWIAAYGLIHPEYSNSVIANELNKKHNIKVTDSKGFAEVIVFA